MATIDPVIVKIQADVSDLKAGLEKAEASLRGIDDSVKKADSGFASFTTRLKQLGATIGITFAGSQMVSFFRDAVTASQQAEAAQARLRNLLINTNDATDAQIEALQRQAKALERVGVVSADTVTVAQSQLATFDLSAAAIGRLTPAILDYVTAERGAAASTEDFKQLTNGLAQALMGNFGSLTRMGFPMDELTKKQIAQGTELERVEGLVRTLNTTYKDFNENLRKTSAGAMQVALNDFNKLKQEIGDGLQPVMDRLARILSEVVIPGLTKLLKMIKNNIDEIKAFAITLGLAAVAWGAYTLAVNRAAIAQAALNLLMRVNPIGILVTVAGLLVAQFVNMWKASEQFRRIVINGAQAVLRAFAAVIPTIADVGETILRVVTGPLRTLLSVIAEIPKVGRFAKSGLDIINKGLDSVSDFGDKASAKAKQLANDLEKLAKISKESGDDLKNNKGGFGPGREEPTTVDPKFIREAKDYNEKLKDIRKDYYERAKDLQERYNEELLDIQERYEENIADLNKRAQKANESDRKSYTKRLLDITKSYNKRETDLAEQLAEKIADIQKSADVERANLRKSAAENEASIVRQSMDRLRSAFASGINFSLEDTLSRGGGITGALKRLTRRLQEAKDLQANAAALAGRGYSQTFIEEIVKAGPRMGNRMAKSILAGSPEATKEIQSLFSQIETISNSGLDSLAETMNKGGNLATEELRKAYASVATDLQQSLAGVDAVLKEKLAEAQKDYAKSMADTAAMRNEAILEATADLEEALADTDAKLKEALIDANAELLKAQVKAKEQFDKGLLDAHEALENSLKEARKSFKKSIEDIENIGRLPGQPSITPFVPTYSTYTSPTTMTTTAPTNNITNNINVEAKTEANPISIADAILYAQKYGQVIQVAEGLGIK